MRIALSSALVVLVLAGAATRTQSQYSTTPVGSSEVETTPGTITGTIPDQPQTVVTNVVAGPDTNLTSQVQTQPGTIRGTTPTESPVVVTNTVPGADVARPAPTIEQKIPKGDVAIELELVAGGMIAPLGISAPDDGSGRLFVYDQAGLVWVAGANGTNEVMLDLRDRLTPLMPGYDERGLIGFAVHTNFAQNPLLYTYTTEPLSGPADFTLPRPDDKQFDHQNVLAEWRIDAANSNRVDVASRREILRIDQPQFNHNGGAIRFGPDGFLYLGLGDGGGADDEDGQPFLGDVVWGHGPTGNGQNTNTLHGSLLRIDVRGTNSVNGSYGIPNDNPFAGTGGVDEIFAYGLRNPYSFSFDRLTGAIYLGDAGQNSMEEINRITAGGNYGWRLKEGSFFFEPAGTAPGYITNLTALTLPDNLMDPIAEFDHDEGRVVVGGFVYRGTNVPALSGKYLASIFIMQNEPFSRLVYVDLGDTNTTPQNAFRELRIGLEDRRPDILVRGFGEDTQGELYVVGSNEVGPMGESGKVFRIAPAPPAILVTNSSRLVVTNGTTGTDLSVEWQGGMGPFGVERKLTLNDLFWNLPLVTTNRQATITGDGPTSVLRITEKPHVVTTAFTALLSGGNVRPTNEVQTAGNGLGLFLLEGSELTYLVLYSNLTATATAADIHGPATPETTGASLIPLLPFGGDFSTTGVLAGSLLLDDHQRSVLLNGQAYVNIDTGHNEEGEIRGHIVPAALASPLRGAWERPAPVLTPAIGNALMALLGNKLTFVINYQGLTSPVTAAHIHGPAGHEEVAPPIVDLQPFLLASGTNGTLAGSVTLTPEQVNMIAGARTYLNIHSENFPQGEIRGHIYLVPGVLPMTVFFSGAAERPTPVDTPAGGFGLLAVAGNRVIFEMIYTNLTGLPSASHIHGPATVEDDAPPVVPLTEFTVATSTNHGFISGMLDLPMPVLVDALNGLTYVNIHTEANPGGEIRSQVAPVLTRASFSGVAERPDPVDTTGVGAGLFALIGNELNVYAGFGNLTAPASAAHIHGPATIRTSASVLVPLSPLPAATGGAIVQTTPLTLEQWNMVVSGLTYLNVHTANHPAGEIRGQLLP